MEPTTSKKHGVSMKKLQHWTAKAKHAVANAVKDPSERTEFKPKAKHADREGGHGHGHGSHSEGPDSGRGDPGGASRPHAASLTHHTLQPLQQQIQQLLKGHKGKRREGSPLTAPPSLEREGPDGASGHAGSEHSGSEGGQPPAPAPPYHYQQQQQHVLASADSGSLSGQHWSAEGEGSDGGDAVAAAVALTSAVAASGSSDPAAEHVPFVGLPSNTSLEYAGLIEQAAAAQAAAAAAVQAAAAMGVKQKGHSAFSKAFSKQAAQQAALQAAGKIRGAAAATAAATAAAVNAAKGSSFVAAATASLAAAGAGRDTAVALLALGVPPRDAAAAAVAAAARDGGAAAAGIKLVSHKRSGRGCGVGEVVLSQTVAAHVGVIWCAALSRDAVFLATAGQDCVLRVWQLTSSRRTETRAGWVYDAGAPPAGLAAAAQQPPQQQQQDQEHAPAVEGGVEPLAADGAPQHKEQQQQQQQQEGAPLATADAAGGADAQPATPAAPAVAAAAAGGPVEWGPYLSNAPVREYHGHTEDILDLSWSSSGFLLTASMDQTVRLWHLSQPDCLKVFRHSDFVTCCQFHPTDAHRFVSGAWVTVVALARACVLCLGPSTPCFTHTLERPQRPNTTPPQPHPPNPKPPGSIDGKLRVWGVLDGAVLAASQLHQDMVTAVAFSPGGSRVVAGTMRGKLRYYEIGAGGKKLEYVTQVGRDCWVGGGGCRAGAGRLKGIATPFNPTICQTPPPSISPPQVDVRNARGQHAGGRKVTSIIAVPGEQGQWLVTSNDSRLRLVRGYGVAVKYKGHRNATTQLRGALSAGNELVACGSDDGGVFMWRRLAGKDAGGGSAGPHGGGGAAGGGGGAGGPGGAVAAGGGGAGPSGQGGAVGAAGGGGSGGGAPGAEELAGAAGSKNPFFQSFQAHDHGVAVTSVAFLPLPNAGGDGAAAGGGAAAAAASGSAQVAAGAAGASTSSAAFDSLDGACGRGDLRYVAVSCGFTGQLRVHEMFSGLGGVGAGSGGNAPAAVAAALAVQRR